MALLTYTLMGKLISDRNIFVMRIIFISMFLDLLIVAHFLINSI